MIRKIQFFLAVPFVLILLAVVYAQNRTQSPFDKGLWKKIGGRDVVPDWPKGINRVGVLGAYRGDLYVGLGGNQAGHAQLWRFKDSKWEQVGGNGIQGSWGAESRRRVNTLLSDEKFLYVGLGDLPGNAELWRWDGELNKWQLLGGGPEGGWSDKSCDEVGALALYKGKLYVGLVADRLDKKALMYRNDDKDQWIPIAGEGEFKSWNAKFGYSGIRAMSVCQDHLFVGMWGRNNVSDDVWSFDGSKWAQVGGDGIRSSWSTWSANYSAVESLTCMEGQLIAVLARPVGKALWSFDGKKWQSFPAQPTEASSPLWKHLEILNHVALYRGSLLLIGGGKSQMASLWEWHHNLWRDVGGFGKFDSWGTQTTPSLEPSRIEWVDSVAEYKQKLVVGLSGTEELSGVWIYQ